MAAQVSVGGRLVRAHHVCIAKKSTQGKKQLLSTTTTTTSGALSFCHVSIACGRNSSLKRSRDFQATIKKRLTSSGSSNSRVKKADENGGGVHHYYHVVARAKKGWFDDPFDYGPDEDITNGDLMAEGKQSAEEQTLFRDPDSRDGYLDFPAGYNIEIASLGTLVRHDVRRCCCLVAGEVYDNLLFFPVIQLLKERWPGVQIDIMASERGKQTYELNKFVRRAWVHNVNHQFLTPVDFTETLGMIKGNYYDMLISTRFAGLGHAMFLSMCDCRQKISYVHPNVNAAGAGNYLDTAIKAPHLDLAEGGYHMYSDLLEHLKVRGETIPPSEVPPLQIGVSKRLQAFVEAKYSKAGVRKGDFLVFHGIESTSFASMQSSGDTDSLLPLPVWATLAKSTRSSVLFVIPNEKDRQRVQEACGEDVHIVFITTPGQLAAVIHASSGVVTTNTAAFQMAHALRKPRVVLFSSQEKADLYLPEVTPECAVIVSKTGKLCDIDTKAAQIAISTIGQESLVAA